MSLKRTAHRQHVAACPPASWAIPSRSCTQAGPQGAFRLALLSLLALVYTLSLAPSPAHGQTLKEQEKHPAALSSWVLEGQLIDSDEVVRSFLRPIMQESRNWSEGLQHDVVTFLERLGYHCIIHNEQLPDGGIRATLVLTPATLVRHVVVSLDMGSLERVKQPLFADEIGRRMTIRPGLSLAPPGKEREAQFYLEARRLQDYLIDDGFFDAHVRVEERSDGPHQAHVTVTVKPGAPYFVGSIEVDGNLEIETNEITKLFHHPRICLVGGLCFGSKRFSRQAWLQDKQTLIDLYQKRGYPGVRIHQNYDPRHSFRRSDHTVNLRLAIRERRLINVEFEFADSDGGVPRDELVKQLTLSKVGSYDDVEVEASAEAIQSFYQGRGNFEAQVTWERELFPEVNFERIVFFVDEGPRLLVRQVSIEGNSVLSSRRLLSSLRTRVYKSIIIGDAGGYATTAQLEQDRQTIVGRYREAGYLAAKVQLAVTRVEIAESSVPVLAAAIAGRAPTKGLAIKFRVHEGPRSIVHSIELDSVDGDAHIPPTRLGKAMLLRAGESFHESEAIEEGRRLERLYFGEGYPRAVVRTTIKESDHRVSIVHHITANSPAVIGKIAIRGNFKTRDWVILNEIKLVEGQKLTPSAAERAQRNLRQSGLFTTAQIIYVGRENLHRKVVNILIRVEERHDYRLSASGTAGYATDSLAFAEGTNSIPNLFGIGASLDLTAHYGQRLRQGDVALKLPRWVMNRYLGARVDFDFTVNYKEDETRRFGLLTTKGLSLALSKSASTGFFAGWLVSLRYDFRLRNNDVFLTRPSGNSDDIQRTKVSTRSSFVGPRLIVDRRRDRQGNSHPLLPASGYRLELNAVFAEDFAFGSNRFLKLGISGQVFWPISKRLTLSSGLRYDHGVPLGGDSLLPQVERYFAGGDTTVRGYEEDRLATERIENPLAPVGSLERFRIIPASGNIRLIQKFDLQINLFHASWLNLASAVFLDTGMVTNSLVGVSPSNLRYGLGVALLRLVLPVGAASLEYAIPLTVEPGDNPRGRFHINLGVLFN